MLTPQEALLFQAVKDEEAAQMAQNAALGLGGLGGAALGTAAGTVPHTIGNAINKLRGVSQKSIGRSLRPGYRMAGGLTGLILGGGSGGGGGNNDGSGGDSPITIPGFPVTDGERVSSMIQNVNQDNDITNTISGDNNTVTNTQDNSVSQSSGYSDYAPRLARSLKDGYLSKLLNR